MNDSALLPDVNVWLASPGVSSASASFTGTHCLRTNNPGATGLLLSCNSAGFLRLASTPAFQRSCNIVGFTNQDALAALEQFMLSPSIAYREEPTGIVAIWHRLAALPSPSPKVWMDAYLAAFAVAGGLQMITLDQEFSQFAGINVTILKADRSTQNP